MSKFKIGTPVFVQGATLAGLFKVVGIQQLDGKNREHPPGCYYSVGNIADPSLFMDMVPESWMATPSELRKVQKKYCNPRRDHTPLWNTSAAPSAIAAEARTHTVESAQQPATDTPAACTDTKTCETPCEPCHSEPGSGASDKKLFAFELGDTVSIIDEHRRVIDGGNLYRVACRTHTDSATDDPNEEASYNLYHLMPLAGGEMQIAKECCLQYAELSDSPADDSAEKPRKTNGTCMMGGRCSDGMFHSKIVLDLRSETYIPHQLLESVALASIEAVETLIGRRLV